MANQDSENGDSEQENGPGEAEPVVVATAESVEAEPSTESEAVETEAEEAEAEPTPFKTGPTDEMPWIATPDDFEKPAIAKPKSQLGTVRMGPASAAPTTERWSDMFDYSPWAAGSPDPRPSGPAPLSPATVARIQARHDRFSGPDPIDNYRNPWQAAEGEAQPMSRRDAIRARAAARRQAELATARGEQSPFAEEPEAGAPQAESQSAAAPEAPEAAAAAAAAAAEVGAPQRRTSRKKTGSGPRDIPVENLPNGVINVLGDGLAAVIDGSITVIRPVAKLVGPVSAAGLVTVAGASVIYGYAHALPFPLKL